MWWIMLLAAIASAIGIVVLAILTRREERAMRFRVREIKESLEEQEKTIKEFGEMVDQFNTSVKRWREQ